jgi:hypothetical protein
MVNGMLVSGFGDAFRFDVDRFALAVVERWTADNVTIQTDDEHEPEAACWAVIEPPSTLPIIIYAALDGRSINVEARPEQMLEALAFLCTLLPDEAGPDIRAVDDDGSGHVELRQGMTAAELAAAWRPDPSHA